MSYMSYAAVSICSNLKSMKKIYILHTSTSHKLLFLQYYANVSWKHIIRVQLQGMVAVLVRACISCQPASSDLETPSATENCQEILSVLLDTTGDTGSPLSAH